MQPVIKWTGSKRYLATSIKSFVDFDFHVYYEPFVGGGSVLYVMNPTNAICGDVCSPLIKLWNCIKKNPKKLVNGYKQRWEELNREGETVYYRIRNEFNKKHNPVDFLFLTRTCVNGLIRFNSKNDFNSSYHHKRYGIHPDRLADIIQNWSVRIKNVDFVVNDYTNTLSTATKNDLVYLDPPYHNTKGQYQFGQFQDDLLWECLEELNQKQIKFMLSYDGVRDRDCFTAQVPKQLYKRHVYLNSANSSYKRLFTDNKHSVVKESLYLNW